MVASGVLELSHAAIHAAGKDIEAEEEEAA
jgi:hypothetical protein